MSKTLSLALAGIFCLCAAFEAEASIVLHLTDQQMTLRADRIVRARVTKKISRWDTKTRRIYTYITMIVLDPIKGAQSSQMVTIRQMGGTANGIGMHIPGSATFALGEEVLVFLEKIRRSTFHHVVSMSYGKFQVVTNAKTKAKTLVRQLNGISLARRSAKGRMKITHGHKLHAVKSSLMLNSYVKKLRGYLKAAKTAPQVRRVTPRPVTPRPVIRRPALRVPAPRR